MIERAGRPRGVPRAVTAIAGRAGLNVGSRLGQCVLRNIGATVAGRAGGTARRRMIHGSRFERHIIVVAATAIRCCCYRRDMHRRFAQCRYAMAAIARTDCRWPMSKSDRSPRGGTAMTCVALRGGGYMGHRLFKCILRDIATTVTRRTLAVQACVIHHGRRPGGEAPRMAGIALRAGRNVNRRLGKGIGENEIAVVTADASASRTGMIHGYRREGGIGFVTTIALPGRWNMVDGLAQRVRPVVTGRTAPSGSRAGTGVVESGRCPCRRRCVTAVALGRRRNVGCRLGLGILGQVSAAMAA